MKQQGMWWALLAVVVIIAVVFASNRPVNVYTTQDQIRKVSVSAESTLEVIPDEAELWIAVNTEATTASQAQDRNTEQTNKVMAQLRQFVDEDDIETASYNLYPQSRWDPETQRSETIGYQVQHSIKVTTTDLDVVGDILADVVDAGANRINNIQFGLSDEQEEQVRAQLLESATSKAKDKAQTLARNSGASVGNVLAISESTSGFVPFAFASARAESFALDEAGSPEINPSEVSVSVSVDVTYELI